MIDEPLDFKRGVQLLARHRRVVLVAAMLGTAAGFAWAMLQPPTLTSQAWIALPPATKGGVDTQVVIAGSDDVLRDALRKIHPAMSLPALRSSVDAHSRTGSFIVITASGKTAAQVEDIANAVANSYVDYVKTPGNFSNVTVPARLFQPASVATGTKPASRAITLGLLGGLAGGSLAAVGVLAVSRRDRRLRERDSIADSIGVPVVASITVEHPSGAAGWRKLLEEYQAGSVDSWRMRKALQYLGVADLNLPGQQRTGITVTVISAAADRKALALGPQLAVFAASLGIPTALVVGPQQDVSAAATLRAACAAPAQSESGGLRVIVRDHADLDPQPGIVLTIVVVVVDAEAPHVTDMIRTSSTVLGVSAGVATAEELARMAASAAVAGHDVVGILVADPDPTDNTTGRLAPGERPAQRRRGPTRMTGTRTELGG